MPRDVHDHIVICNWNERGMRVITELRHPEGKPDADIVIIDTDSFVPIADFEDPTELSTGVRQMLVNGENAIVDGEVTGDLAGELIDRRNLDCR